MQAVDARVVQLEVLPEPLAQVVSQGPQAVVVQSGLAFAQVVHEQVADGPAGELVAVDQFVGGLLASGAQLPQPGWSLVTEDPQLVQNLVERGPSPGHPASTLVSTSSSSRTSPTMMSVSAAALGSDDHRGPLQGPQPCSCGDTRMLVAAVLPAAQTQLDHGSWPRSPARAPLTEADGHEPAQRGTDEISADRHLQRSRQLRRQPLRPPAVVDPASATAPAASCSGGLSTAVAPAVLPGRHQAGPRASRAAWSARGLRLLSVPAFARTNGGLVDLLQISSRLRRVAGQSRASGRAGKRARADSRCSSVPAARRPAWPPPRWSRCSVHRTGRSGSPAGSRGRERA